VSLEISPRVLVVDDDSLVADAVGRYLSARGFDITIKTSGADALEALETVFYEAVLVDVNMPGVDGFAVLDASARLPEPPVALMMTGRADVKLAVAAMRRGATDFLEKPMDMSDLVTRLERGIENARMRRKLAALEEDVKKRTQIVSAPKGPIEEALRLADKVAATPHSSALLIGESGVGKEVIAARIHERSARKHGPFVRVNMAAVADSMVEAELFGSVKGAFTDAKRDRAGFFATADGGTILLDELGEFKMEHQAKLLRVIEERRFFPVGSDRERGINVRVLAATNRDPEKMIAEGVLRADLYYRLAAVTIRIPPLRARKDEIPELATHFTAEYCREFRRPLAELSADAVAALTDYTWPGNVRELKNVIERAVMLCEGDTITAELFDFPSSVSIQAPRKISLPPPASLKLDDVTRDALERVEKDHIARVLASVAGSRTKAAELLGVSRSTLWDKLKRYKME
jgi:two-component system response regulator HydG